MKAKSKSKRNVRKFGRLKFTEKEEPQINDDTIDLSNLRKPIPTSLSSLRQVTKLFDNGSDEVKSILDYECEVIYECRICRSLFRSLANFISHKRVYCRVKFDISMDKSAIDPPSMKQTNQIPVSDPESKENCKNDRTLRSQSGPKSPIKKDLTSVVAMLQQKQTEDPNDTGPMRILADNEQVLLEIIESNNVAYQTVLEPSTNIDKYDLMKAQANEVQSILSRDTAVLGPDGQLLEVSQMEKSDSPLQIYDNPDDSLSSNSSIDGSNLICSVCDAKFATKKTLTFHMKSLHTPHRMVYPCPCCENLFTNPWGVYRHLYKIHRKSNEQVRKLRAQIQEKAYRTESTRAQDIEKDCANSKVNNNHEAIMNETEEWMAHLESDGELQRCGGCGKRFDRKAALLSHSQICVKRIAACSDGAARAKRQQKSTEITESASLTSRLQSQDTSISVKDIIPKVVSVKEKKEDVLRLPNISSAVTITRLSHEPEISIRVEGVSSLSKDAWDKMGNDLIDNNSDSFSNNNNSSNSPENTGIICKNERSSPGVDDEPEIIFTKVEKGKSATKKRKIGKGEGQRRSPESLLKRSKTPSARDRSSTPERVRPVSNRVKAIERRIATIADLQKLRCLPCNKKFSSMAHLRRHMAIHINWNRYRCKVCGFKCFEKVDCVAHCNMAHDAKNNRTIIAGMMAEIQPDDANAGGSGNRSLLKKQAMKEQADLEVIDVTKPKTTSDDIANANEEMDCIQNGDIQRTKKGLESTGTCSESEEPPEDPTDRSKRVKLDEDPELRRMVMEVIFGSSEGSSSSSEKSHSSGSTQKLVDREISIERSTSSSPATIEPNPSPKTEEKLQRPTRNRSKVIDKDFIYDLDAVLLQETVVKQITQNPETSCLKVTNDKKRNSIDLHEFKESDDLVVLFRDEKIDKLQEIQKNIIVCDK